MNAMPAPTLAADVHADRRTVVRCYSILDLAVEAGVSDFTEGIYQEEDTGNDRAAYLRAQHRQTEYLLDQVLCGAGSRILDVGCGHGRLLKQAGQRRARAVGVTISAEQVRRCLAEGLDVRLADYRTLTRQGTGLFTGIVANGSLEHFVQAADAAAGRAEEIYGEFFAICRRLVSAGDRLATTVIHCRRPNQFSAEEIERGPGAFARGTDEYHYSLLSTCTFGGWYPEPGQLKRCAAPSFRLIREEDGTRDYHLTSEYWLRRLKRTVATSPRFWLRFGRRWLGEAQGATQMLRCLLWDQSWNWQFRGDPPPTRLLRQTWEALPAEE